MDVPHAAVYYVAVSSLLHETQAHECRYIMIIHYPGRRVRNLPLSRHHDCEAAL